MVFDSHEFILVFLPIVLIIYNYAKYKIKNINYIKINLINQLVKQNVKTHGGHNKEIFMLSIEIFKKFCLKADDIHRNFIDYKIL